MSLNGSSPLPFADDGHAKPGGPRSQEADGANAFSAEDSLADMAHPIDAETLKALERDAVSFGRRGAWLFAVAVAIGCALIILSWHLTTVYVEDLNTAARPELMLILLLVRGTLFGALCVGFLYGVFTVATAFIDQSTRFRKRLYSAHMLNYAFSRFIEQIKTGVVPMRDVVSVFEAWNSTVDSAFSSVKFQKRSKDLSVSGGTTRVDLVDPAKEPSQNSRRLG